MVRSSTLITVMVFAASLTACSSTTDASCVPLIAPGNASELVSATALPGSKPTVDFPAPLVANTPQRSVLVSGAGEQITRGSVVDFEVSVLEGNSGETVLQSRYREGGVPGVHGTAGQDGFLFEALVCARVGERIVVTGPFNQSGIAANAPDVEDTVVFVIDPVAHYLGKADGKNRLPLDGMPGVVTAPNGTPGITLPGAPPESTRSATLKIGNGAVITAGNQVVLHYSSWVWPQVGTNAVSVESTWTQAPVVRLLESDPSGVTGFAPGLFGALEGVTVGSQVLAVIKPEDFVSDEAWPVAVPEGATVVYVVDVLGVSPKTD